MDPKLLFWTGAFVNMALVLGLAVGAVRARRRGDVGRHAHSMLAAGALVGLFLVSYVFKLALLGREPMELWSTGDVWWLRIHETCVAAMLVSGSLAGHRARALRRTRNATAKPTDPPAAPATVSWHRRAGGVAVASAALGFLTAGMVLLGMYRRAGVL